MVRTSHQKFTISAQYTLFEDCDMIGLIGLVIEVVKAHPRFTNKSITERGH